MHDKAYWRAIIDDQYAMPEGEDLLALTNELLNYIGHPDPELREEFGYSILSRWIAVYRYHDLDQLKSLGRWLSTRLDKGIGEVDTDSVFLRSFSAAVLSLIMYRDVREQFLEPAAINGVLETAQLYLLYERDLRPRDPQKGWINAVANTSSLLRHLAMNPKLNKRQQLSIMDVVLQKIAQPMSFTYTHDEEERLARVLIPIMMRDEVLVEDYMIWFESFKEWLTKHDNGGQYDAIYNCTYQNIKRFLRSLHIQNLLSTRMSEEAIAARPDLLDTVREFSV